MKNSILLIASAVLLVACKPEPVRYTQQSPEINMFKSVLKSYNNNDLAGMNAAYADTAKIFVNSASKGYPATEANAQSMEGNEAFSEHGFVFGDDDIEMVVTDKGETWVNCWGEWKATFAGNGEQASIAFHSTAQFIDGKIVREYDYFDASELMKKFEEMEAAMKATTDSTSTAGM